MAENRHWPLASVDPIIAHMYFVFQHVSMWIEIDHVQNDLMFLPRLKQQFKAALPLSKNSSRHQKILIGTLKRFCLEPKKQTEICWALCKCQLPSVVIRAALAERLPYPHPRTERWWVHGQTEWWNNKHGRMGVLETRVPLGTSVPPEKFHILVEKLWWTLMNRWI